METFASNSKSRQGSRWISAGSDNELNLGDIIAASGVSPRLWRLYACFWLVCLFFPVLDLVQAPPAGLHLAAAGLIAFTTIYTLHGHKLRFSAARPAEINLLLSTWKSLRTGAQSVGFSRLSWTEAGFQSAETR